MLLSYATDLFTRFENSINDKNTQELSFSFGLYDLIDYAAELGFASYEYQNSLIIKEKLYDVGSCSVNISFSRDNKENCKIQITYYGNQDFDSTDFYLAFYFRCMSFLLQFNTELYNMMIVDEQISIKVAMQRAFYRVSDYKI